MKNLLEAVTLQELHDWILEACASDALKADITGCFDIIGPFAFRFEVAMGLADLYESDPAQKECADSPGWALWLHYRLAGQQEGRVFMMFLELKDDQIVRTFQLDPRIQVSQLPIN